MARYGVFFTTLGAPKTGLTPAIVWRNIDGTSAGSVPAVVELDGVNAPGWYYFDTVPTARIVVTVDGGGVLANPDRYKGNIVGPDDFASTEARFVLLDSPFTVLKEAISDQVWDEAVAGHVTAGTFGLLTQLIGGLVKANHRIKNPVYDGEGRLLTCDLAVYPSGADADADTNILDTFSVTATYDGSGNLLTFLSKN